MIREKQKIKKFKNIYIGYLYLYWIYIQLFILLDPK